MEDDPKTYGETMNSIDASFWREFVNGEMDSILCNKTWFLTDLPYGCKIIECKLIFRKKLRIDEIIEKFKTRLLVLDQKKKVCRLVKSFYRLKQAPKQLYEKFDRVIKSNGFLINDFDKCVYIKVFNDACVILCLYVDDIFIFGTNLKVIK